MPIACEGPSIAADARHVAPQKSNGRTGLFLVCSGPDGSKLFLLCSDPDGLNRQSGRSVLRILSRRRRLPRSLATRETAARIIQERSR